jgi:hypothetical protein
MKVLVINATNDDKVVGDLKYVTVKNPQINLQKNNHMDTKKSKKRRQKWRRHVLKVG